MTATAIGGWIPVVSGTKFPFSLLKPIRDSLLAGNMDGTSKVTWVLTFGSMSKAVNTILTKYVTIMPSARM